MQKKLAQKEKEAKEEHLRMLAQKAREERYVNDDLFIRIALEYIALRMVFLSGLHFDVSCG
jgi:hypothetical protein